MLNDAFIMSEALFEAVYSKDTQAKIKQLVNIDLPVMEPQAALADPEKLAQVEVLFSGWGAPVLDQTFLDVMPRLRIIFYAAGTMKQLLTDTVWQRGIRVTTANTANAIPMAEFTLAEILFSLKNGWQLANQVKKEKTFVNGVFQPVTGIYQAKVGLISLSSIGRRVAELLAPFEVDLLIYDPYVSAADAAQFNATKTSLTEIFAAADVISIHTPLLPETTGMVTGELIKQMKANATLINTARGAIINEAEMIAVLAERPDLTALLDVTYPEPPAADSKLYTLENVVITPHIAGSVGNERARLGDFMLSELENYLASDQLDHEITEASYRSMA